MSTKVPYIFRKKLFCHYYGDLFSKVFQNLRSLSNFSSWATESVKTQTHKGTSSVAKLSLAPAQCVMEKHNAWFLCRARRLNKTYEPTAITIETVQRGEQSRRQISLSLSISLLFFFSLEELTVFGWRRFSLSPLLSGTPAASPAQQGPRAHVSDAALLKPISSTWRIHLEAEDLTVLHRFQTEHQGLGCNFWR